jgi:hypothetical protein
MLAFLTRRLKIHKVNINPKTTAPAVKKIMIMLMTALFFA